VHEQIEKETKKEEMLVTEEKIEEQATKHLKVEKASTEEETKSTTEEETEVEEESEPEPVKEPVKEEVMEPVKEPHEEKPAPEPDKPASVKKKLVLEGVKVEEEQFEKVVQEVSEEVQVEEKVETKKLASGFGAATVTELTSESVTLNWEEPKDTGGVKIIRYLIVMRETDKTKYKKIGEVDGDTHSYTVTKIKDNHEYQFRVYAQNEVGISTEAAEVANSVKIPKRKKEKTEPKAEPAPEPVEEKVETQTLVESQKITEIVKEEEQVVKEVCC